MMFRGIIRLKASVAALIVLAVLGYGQAQLLTGVHRTSVPTSESYYWGQYANTRMIKRFLGMRIAASDLIWIDLLFKADIFHEKAGFTPFYKATQAVLDLDPNNFLAAWFGALYLSVIKDDIRGASVLFEEAILRLQNAPWVESTLRGSIYYAYGYHALYEEQDPLKAHRLIELASKERNAPELAKRLADTLSSPSGRIEVGFRVLNDIYRRAKTPEEKARIEKKMTNLLIEKELLELNTQFEDYLMRSESKALARQTAFRNFLRFMNHRGKNALGRPLILNDAGRIVSGE